jgi:hypothetical protein
MVRPRSAPASHAASRAARARRASIPERLVAHHVFSDGEPLQIVVPTGVGEDRETIQRWLEVDERRHAVRWRSDPRAPVVWSEDGESYNLTTLIGKIIELATGEPPRTQVWGPNWYRDGNDQVLYRIAEALDDE